MKHEDAPQQDLVQPVAYDTQGNPLYAAPQAEQNVVHITRSVNPVKQEVSPEVKKKHQYSKKMFPRLNLSEAEFIIRYVRRHPIGLLGPALAAVILITMIITFMINYSSIMAVLGVVDPVGFGTVFVLCILMIVLVAVIEYMSIWIYVNNQFFLTNESVIQEVQISLFSRREQTVSLANIEDVSFHQSGILQLLLNYGSIRLSTEGDETTYRFNYVSNPKEETAALNNAVEAFKNGRPVDDN